MDGPGFDADAFCGLLGGDAVGRDVAILDEVDSTSTELWRRIGAGAGPGTIVVAGRQTAGRGRHGRVWHSPPAGNLYLSVAVSVGAAPSETIPLVPLVAGVAAAEAIDEACEVGVTLKWPNDLKLDGRKVGGILCEVRDLASSPTLAVVGLGLNTGSRSFPEELAEIAIGLRAAAAAPVVPERIAAFWLTRLERMVARLDGSDPAWLIERWRGLGEPFGRRVRVGGIVGTTVDLDPRGRLVIALDGGGEAVIAGGEVVTHVPG